MKHATFTATTYLTKALASQTDMNACIIHSVKLGEKKRKAAPEHKLLTAYQAAMLTDWQRGTRMPKTKNTEADIMFVQVNFTWQIVALQYECSKCQLLKTFKYL